MDQISLFLSHRIVGYKVLPLATREEIVVVVELPTRALAPAIGIVLAELIARHSQHAQCGRVASRYRSHIL